PGEPSQSCPWNPILYIHRILLEISESADQNPTCSGGILFGERGRHDGARSRRAGQCFLHHFSALPALSKSLLRVTKGRQYPVEVNPKRARQGTEGNGLPNQSADHARRWNNRCRRSWTATCTGSDAIATPSEITTIAAHSRGEMESRVISSEQKAPMTGTSAESTPTV